MSEPNTGTGSWVEKLHSTTDAKVWASQFMNNVGTIGFVIDQDLMLGWFANAIETGKSHERRRLLGDPSKHEFWQAVGKPITERLPRDKVLAAAILLMSTRGDIFVKNADGEDVPCSALTMEGIFDALIVMHDQTLLPVPR